MDTTSLWRSASSVVGGHAPLQGDHRTEVLVVGGGITGITLAWLAARQGRKVTVLEAATVGSGTTGHSTGNLYQTVSGGFATLASRWGADVARHVAAERGAAIAFIEAHAPELPDAGFRRCPLLQWALEPQQQEGIEREYAALSAAGCTVHWSDSLPLPLPAPAGRVLVLEGQAQLQPQAYVEQLAQLAVAAGAVIHEGSPVLEIDERDRTVATANGSVQGDALVLATHSPKGFHVVQAEMPVEREYGIALDWPQVLPPGIWWSEGEPGLSVRLATIGGRNYAVCIGRQGHKPGLHNARAALLALEAQAGGIFAGARVTHRWSAQNWRGADGLPYFGRNTAGTFIATGFATDGLVWGTVAARAIAAELQGAHTPIGELCRPLRLSPVKGAKGIAEEVGTMAKSLVQDWLTHRQVEALATLAPGDSAIVQSDDDPVAAWRAPGGELYAVSTTCTHLGCKVHWNSVETSWDCACHGSRFRPDGSVIEGPALRPLARRRPPATLG